MELKRHKDFIKESKDGDLWIYDGVFIVGSALVLNGKFIENKIPDIINGDFICSSMNLISLEGGPKEVNGNFYAIDNKLTSLKGCPNKIKGLIDVDNNPLETLEYFNSKIGGVLYLQGDSLKSLEYMPKNIRFVLYGNKKHLRVEELFLRTYYKNNYWEDLLKYMIKNKIDLEEVQCWPDGFLTDETIRSTKGISKFNL